MKVDPYKNQISIGGNTYTRGGSLVQPATSAQQGMSGAGAGVNGASQTSNNNSWMTPKDANQQAARTLGYTGPFGTGGIDAWRKANNVTDTAFQQAGGNKQLGINNPNATTNQSPYATPPGTTWNDPRDKNQQAARNLGYTGPFGTGGIDAWRRANNISDQQFSQAGGNKVLGINAPAQPSAMDNLYNNLSQLFNSYYGSPMNNLPSSVQNPSVPALGQPTQMDLPPQLADLQGLSDQQQRSAIATNALYGAGADPQAQQYYLNLLQKDVQGNPQNFDNALPIERNFLQSLGLPISSSNDFLSGLSRYYANLGAYT